MPDTIDGRWVDVESLGFDDEVVRIGTGASRHHYVRKLMDFWDSVECCGTRMGGNNYQNIILQIRL